MKKINVIRELEIYKIEYIVREYEVDEEYLDVVSVVLKINKDIIRVFKILVLLNEKREMVVVCILGMEKFDLKKLGKFLGYKKFEMLLMKDLFLMIGYVRGGCFFIGIKKRYFIFIYEFVLDNKIILVSGGLRGL